MLEALRQEVFELNLELPRHGLVVMTSGNVSGRDPESNLVIIKPSGVRYERMKAQDMVILDLDGKIIEGDLSPSVDTESHLYIYRNRPDVFGVCHTHSTFASVYAALGRPIPACLTTTAMLGGEIPVGDFIPVGGSAIGEEVVRKIGDKKAILMQNHGIFTIGKDAYHATKMAIEVEQIAKITCFASLMGNPIALDDEQISTFAYIYQNVYGQRPK
jgi:L-ribulose-5-phosphate 4-epimerase